MGFGDSGFGGSGGGAGGDVTVSQISDASANGRSLISAADYAAMKTLLALTIGTNVQAYNAVLTTLAGASANGQSLITAANYAAMVTLLNALTSGGALGTPSSGSLANCTGLPVAGGGTGAATAAAARTNLGLRTLNTVTYSGTPAFDLNTSNKHLIVLAGNPTFSLSNDADGDTFSITVKQSSGGSNTITWWSGILWDSGAAPTQTATANKYDVYTFERISSGVYLGGRALTNC